MTQPEAFALLVLPNITLTTGQAPHAHSETGVLALECVTVPHPGGSSGTDRDVYLVLRLNTSETPLDPERIVHRVDKASAREYIFYGSANDAEEIRLSFPTSGATPPGYLEDLETFESIIGQYHGDIKTGNPADPFADNKYAGIPRGGQSGAPQTRQPTMGTVSVGGVAKGDADLRGHLVMIDESTGEIVGQVEDRLRIHEDPMMHMRGHENDPVIIEVAEQSPEDEDANALEAFARYVPPEEQNWVTKGATVVSHAISLTTSLVVTTITAASNYYINHSAPSPHHSGASTPVAGAVPKDPNAPKNPNAPPIPPRPKALVFLTSERTKSNLRTVNAVSGEAVKVSAKTVSYIDNMIRKAIGAGPKRERTAFFKPAPGTPGGSQPPPYTPDATEKGGLKSPPPLPPRGSSPAPPPLPPRAGKAKLGFTNKVLISADLILSTIDHSTRQLIDTGTSQFGKVMYHKYGEEAAESSTLIANSARNVGLVYVDMRGIGRRALLKRVGKTYVKTKVKEAHHTASQLRTGSEAAEKH